MRKLFINVQGGTGLNFGLSSFITWIKENGDENGNKDYEFNVCSPYYDIFQCNPNVTNVYKGQELKDLILDCHDEGGELFVSRLYDFENFIYKRVNYSEAWAELLGIPFKDTLNGTKVKSKLNVYSQFPSLKNMVEDLKKQIEAKYKDFVIMQFTGGQSPLVQVPPKRDQKGNPINEPDWMAVPYNYEQEPLKRHYPMNLAQEFVNHYHASHPDTAIILFQLPNEPGPSGDFIFRTTMPYLAYYELAKEAKEIVAIDSSLQHMTAGLTKTTVLWAHSLPEHFGYSYNNNIIQKCRRDDLFYFTALGPCGSKVNYIQPKDFLEALDGKSDKENK